jgi:hypothetical protein
MLPVARHEVIAPVVLVPVFRYPVRATTLANEAPVNPNVPMSIPSVVTGSPHVPRTRWRHFHHTGRWRCNVDLNSYRGKCWRHGANEQRRCHCGQYERSKSPRGNVPMGSTSSETNCRGIHFHSTSVQKWVAPWSVNAHAQAGVPWRRRCPFQAGSSISLSSARRATHNRKKRLRRSIVDPP